MPLALQLPVDLVLALDPSLVDRCLMFEKSEMRMVVEFFLDSSHWLILIKIDSSSAHQLRAEDESIFIKISQ